VSNVKFCTGFVPLTQSSVTPTDPSFPFSNVTNYKFPQRPYKATSTATTSAPLLRFTIPANTTIKGFFISGTNATSMTLNSWSDTYSTLGDVQHSFTTVKDIRTGRYNFISTKDAAAGTDITTTDQYWELKNNTPQASLIDDPNKFYVNSIYLFTSVTTMNYTFQHPYRVSRSRAHVRTDRGNLSHDVIDLNSKKISITMPWTLPTRAEDQTTGGEEMFYTLMDSNLADGFVFWENRDLGNNEVDSRAYHVRTITDISVTYPQGTDRIMDAGTLDFEEII
jgi:hypothetical protein